MSVRQSTTGTPLAIGATITNGTEGSVLFLGSGGILAQDNSNFFWDDTNNSLGINPVSTTLQARLHIGNGADAPGFGSSATRAIYATFDGQTDFFFRDSSADIVGRFTAGPAGSGTLIGAATNHHLGLISNNTIRIYVDSDGDIQLGGSAPTAAAHVEIPATTGLVSLIVTGAANQNTIELTASGTTSQSYGPRIHAGTNSSDRSFLIRDATGASDYFVIYGDGVTVFNESGISSGDVRMEGDFNANLFFLDASADKIGIGTNSPESRLEIEATHNSSFNVNSGSMNLAMVNITSTNSAGTGVGGTLQFSGNSGVQTHGFGAIIGAMEDVGTNWAGYLGFYTTASNSTMNERMRITSTGRLGIGTTGPDRRLDILDASNPQLRLTHTDGSVYSDLQTNGNGDFNMTPTSGRAFVFGTTAGSAGGVFQLYGDPNGTYSSIQMAAPAANPTMSFRLGSTGASNITWQFYDGPIGSVFMSALFGTSGMFFTTSTGLPIYFRPGAAGVETFQVFDTQVVVNDLGLSTCDFRVEGDTATHLLFVDASADKIGINNSTPSGVLSIRGSGDVLLVEDASGNDYYRMNIPAVGRATFNFGNQSEGIAAAVNIWTNTSAFPDALTVTQTENGVTNTAGLFTVSGAGTNNRAIVANATNGTNNFAFYSANGQFVLNDAQSATSDLLAKGDTDAALLLVDASGDRVKIGTTSDSNGLNAKLAVFTNASDVHLFRARDESANAAKTVFGIDAPNSSTSATTLFALTSGGTGKVNMDAAGDGYWNGNVIFGSAVIGSTHKVEVRQNSTTDTAAGVYIQRTGNVTGTSYGQYVTTTGASTTNIGLYVTVSGATNNYGIISTGPVGAGVSTVTTGYFLEVLNAVRISSTTQSARFDCITTAADGNEAGFLVTGGGTNANWFFGTNRGDIFGVAGSVGFYANAGSTGTKFVLTNGGNLILGGGTAAGASATSTLSIKNGTAPTGNVTDQFQMYSADQAAGNAAPHFRTEDGSVVKIYQQTGIADADGTLADITTKFNSLLAKMEAFGLLSAA